MSTPVPAPLNPSTVLHVVDQVDTTPRYTSVGVSDDDSDQMRREYLDAIVQPNWFEILFTTLSTLSTATCTLEIDAPLPYGHGEARAPFCIGRLVPISVPDDGIPMNINDTTVSRCHVFVVSVGDEICVVDVGSLFGVYTNYRSFNLPCEHSVTGDRRMLKFGRDEYFVLQLGANLVCFNKPHAPDPLPPFGPACAIPGMYNRAPITLPGELMGVPGDSIPGDSIPGDSVPIPGDTKCCVVCLDSKRVERLWKCGHSVACPTCLDRMTTCPLCREPFTDSDRRRALNPNLTYACRADE